MAMDQATFQAFLTTQNETMMSAVRAIIEGMQKSGKDDEFGKGKSRPIDPVIFKRMEKFPGGEEAFMEWAFDFKMTIKSQKEHMEYAMVQAEKLVFDKKQEHGIRGIINNDFDGVQDDKYKYIEGTEADLYQHLCLMTEGEAKMIVKSCESGDGYLAWAKLTARYHRRTLTRLMKINKEVMYPQEVKDRRRFVEEVLRWEEKWRKMLKGHPDGIKIPVIWQMSAFLELCPKDIRERAMSRIDEITEDYELLKQKVLMWVGNEADDGGPRPMDIGNVRNEMECGMCGMEGDYWEDWEANVVEADAKCYNCGGHGHFSRNCPKGGGKNGFKGGGKTGWKGGGKSYFGGKGKGGKGGFGKGGKGGKGDFGKGGKQGGGKGYQGTCFTCGKVGHKAWECWGAYAVEEMEEQPNQQQNQHEEETQECGSVWVIGNVNVEEEEFEECEDWEDCEMFDEREIAEHLFKHHAEEVRAYAKHEGVDVFQAAEEMTEEVVMTGRKAEIVAEMKGLRGGWKTEKRKTRNQRKREATKVDPKRKTFEPRWKPLGTTGGRFAVLEQEEDVDICVVEPKTETEEITVDSGAGRNVWPRTRAEGGKVQKLKRAVRLSAANGQEMKVDGEKQVRFESDGRRCGMNFLVTDVKKPLAAVSAIVDEGNVVVFGPGPWGSFIQNVGSGEKIFMERKRGTYVMKVKFEEGAGGRTCKDVMKAKFEKGPSQDDGGQRPMEIGAADIDSVFTGRK